MVEEGSSEAQRAKTIIVAAITKGKIDPVIKIHQQLLPINEPIMDGSITTLMLVAGKGTADDIAKVLQLSPDLNQTDSYGRTAIHFACRSGNLDTFS